MQVKGTSVKGNQIRIGIDAPRDITVNREEIYQRILKEQKVLNGTRWVRNPTNVLSLPDKR